MSTIQRPLRRDAERNRQRVLEAARDLFARKGLGVTLDDVADHAGVGVGTVYRRFPDKEALIEALFEERIEEIATLAERALEDPDAWRGFVGFLESSAERNAANRGLQELLFSAAHGKERMARARERIRPLVELLVARAQAAGALRPDFDPLDVPLLQFMVGAVGWYAAEVAPEVWRRHLAIVIDGLRTQRRRPTPLPVPALTQDQFEAALRACRLP